MSRDYEPITVKFYLDENDIELLEELVEEFKKDDVNNECPNYDIKSEIRSLFRIGLIQMRAERELKQEGKI